LAFVVSGAKKSEKSGTDKGNESVVLVAVFDHKHASLFKKNPNSQFQGIYSKKLLTLLNHIRIMRSVLSDKAT
jgi:hypothetical protein